MFLFRLIVQMSLANRLLNDRTRSTDRETVQLRKNSKPRQSQRMSYAFLIVGATMAYAIVCVYLKGF